MKVFIIIIMCILVFVLYKLTNYDSTNNTNLKF